jgi:hypothetical protein
VAGKEMTRPLAVLALVVLPGVAAAADAAKAVEPKAADPKAAESTAGESSGTYETAGQGAVRTNDVATLLSSFVERCTGEKRELDRARCRATTAYLRRTLPKRTFAFTTDDPAVIAVSDYDAAVKGYHVALAGCIACSKPIAIGRAGDPRFVTVKVPDKDAETLIKAVSLSRNTFGFDTLQEAKQWLDTERPYLRAEFLFQPDADSTDWTFASKNGVALKLLGTRIYNRCTGDVLVSKPPSTGMAERPAPGREDPSCAGARSQVARAGRADSAAPALESMPPELSKALIADAMAKIRPRVFACYKKHQSPGTLELTYLVAGNGTVQSVAVGAAYAGTPTGQCVLDVAKDARFPAFKLDQQKFTYPFFLRQ